MKDYTISMSNGIKVKFNDGLVVSFNFALSQIIFRKGMDEKRYDLKKVPSDYINKILPAWYDIILLMKDEGCPKPAINLAIDNFNYHRKKTGFNIYPPSDFKVKIEKVKNELTATNFVITSYFQYEPIRFRVVLEYGTIFVDYLGKSYKYRTTSNPLPLKYYHYINIYKKEILSYLDDLIIKSNSIVNYKYIKGEWIRYYKYLELTEKEAKRNTSK